jgi:hypothetical protein
MAFQSTSKFFLGSRLVFGSVLFIADKMGDLSLQELESLEIVGLGIDHFPPPPQLESVSHARHNSGMDPAYRGNLSWIPQGVMPTTTRCVARMQQIQSTSRLRSLTQTTTKKFSWWGKLNPPPPSNQTAEITQEADTKNARAARLVQEADKVASKRHRGRQDDSGAFEDGAEDGATSIGHLPKFNRQRLAG